MENRLSLPSMTSAEQDDTPKFPYPYRPHVSDAVYTAKPRNRDTGPHAKNRPNLFGPLSAGPSSSTDSGPLPGLPEHRKLFGYKSDVSHKYTRGKSSASSKHRPAKKAKVNVWKKEVICLDQCKGLDTEEWMELARMGLGLREVKFNVDGDAIHIRDALIDAFGSRLNDCRGYTLLRLASNSTSLIVIQPPKSGMMVRYLKDIVKTAKLFVRPLRNSYSTPRSGCKPATA